MSSSPSPPRSRRSRRVAWTAAVVGTVLVALVAVLATRPQANTRLADSRLLGEPAPAVEADTIDGEVFVLGELSGRWVLVNFFATWCVPCRQEHDDLIRFHRAGQVSGETAVVGVVYSDSVGAVVDFRAAEGGDWPMLADPEGRVALDFGVAGVPESYLVSPQGVVVAKVVGGVSYDGLVDLLERAKALTGAPVSP